MTARFHGVRHMDSLGSTAVMGGMLTIFNSILAF